MIIDKQKKFKTSYLGIKFKEEIKKEHIGFRALLPNLLKTRSPKLIQPVSYFKRL